MRVGNDHELCFGGSGSRGPRKAEDRQEDGSQPDPGRKAFLHHVVTGLRPGCPPRGTRGERQREKFPPVCGYGWKAAREPQRAAPVSSSAVKQVTQASSRLSQARFMTPR